MRAHLGVVHVPSAGGFGYQRHVSFRGSQQRLQLGSMLSALPSPHPSIRPCIIVSVRACVRASVRACVRPCVRACVRPSVRPSVCVHPSVRPSICQSGRLCSVRPSVRAHRCIAYQVYQRYVGFSGSHQRLQLGSWFSQLRKDSEQNISKYPDPGRRRAKACTWALQLVSEIGTPKIGICDGWDRDT